MGLDVYLYRHENFEETQRLETEFDNYEQNLWDSLFTKYGLNTDENRYEKVPPDEKESVYSKLVEWKKIHGYVGEGNYWNYEYSKDSKIELNSTKYPDHMFKIGYLRSSYNEGGLNRVLRDSIGKDLYYVFFGETEEDREDTFSPDWSACLARAKEVLDLFSSYQKSGSYRVMPVKLNMFAPFGRDNELLKIDSSEAALKVFMKEKERTEKFTKETADRAKQENKEVDDEWGTSYSNLHGEFFFGKPLDNVRGIVAGIDGSARNIVGKMYNRPDYNPPCFYVVYEDVDNLTWYRQALEITIEMIEYAIAQPDPDKYYIYWSS